MEVKRYPFQIQLVILENLFFCWENKDKMDKRIFSVQLYAFGTIFLWASAFVFTKIALNYYSPETIGVSRYLIAAIFFIVLGCVKKIGFPERKDIPKFFLSGVLGFTIYMIAFNRASSSLTSATGSIIIATAPIITAILAFILFKERIKFLGWVAIVVDFVGIIVLTGGYSTFSSNSGILWMITAAVCISGYNLFQRDFVKKYSAIQSTAYSIFAGTLCLLVYLPKASREIASVSVSHLLILFFLGVFPSALAYLWWAKALMMADKTSDVTNFMFITPFLAALMGFCIMGEIPTIMTGIGGLMIIAGLMLFKKEN